MSFRQKNYPTLHSFHVKKSFASYKFSLRFLKRFFLLVNNNSALKSIFSSKNDYHSTILFFYFFKKNFLRFFNLAFFKKIDTLNLIKIFTLFLLCLSKLKSGLLFFNLNNHNDWFNYNFNQNKIFFLKKSLINTQSVKLYSLKKLNFFKKKYNHYADFFKINFNKFLHV